MEENEVVVLRVFENSIDANLARTKLEANDIQCFLTGENMTNLYPLQNKNLFSVNLHVFQKDRKQAEDILNEEYTSQEEIVTCPQCQSTNVKIEQIEKLGKKPLSFIVSVFKAILFPLPRVYRCENCQHEF
jgi:Zn finger protein HypA/HybF involved in hydrogenase expression